MARSNPTPYGAHPPERNERNVRALMPLLTELAGRYGYSRVSKLCKQAGDDPNLLRSLLAREFPEGGLRKGNGN